MTVYHACLVGCSFTRHRCHRIPYFHAMLGTRSGLTARTPGLANVRPSLQRPAHVSCDLAMRLCKTVRDAEPSCSPPTTFIAIHALLSASSSPPSPANPMNYCYCTPSPALRPQGSASHLRVNSRFSPHRSLDQCHSLWELSPLTVPGCEEPQNTSRHHSW